MIHWIGQLQNILSQSYTEQNAYDFKQGFTRLDGSAAFDEDNFTKILKTAVGIANIRRGYRGYILVGVADKASDAERVKTLYGAEAIIFEGFSIVGVDGETQALGKTHDQMFQMIVEKVRNSPLSSPLKDHIVRHIKAVRYYDKTIYVFDVEAQEDPSHYDGEYFVRNGAQLGEIPTTELTGFIRRFDRGG